MSKNNEKKSEKLDLGDFLGQGAFARCYKYTPDGREEPQALKIIPKSKISNRTLEGRLRSEISIHKSLQHPHIVNFCQKFEDELNIYIVLELCKNGTFSDLLKQRSNLSEIEVQCYMLQLISALKYLRSLNIIHRDLKLSNLLLSDRMTLKISDFGLAVQLKSPESIHTSMSGTPNYVAPEVILQKGHSFQVDVWALGVVMYTLLVGAPPFTGTNIKMTCQNVSKGQFSFPKEPCLSDEAKALITKILETDPNKRPALDEIAVDDFFYKNPIPFALPASACTSEPTFEMLEEFLPRSLNLVAVKKWADFSTDFGTGFLLSNGTYGVVFNDSSSLCRTASKYLYRNGNQTTQFAEVPQYLQQLKEKLDQVKEYLGVEQRFSDEVVFVDSIAKEKEAVIFSLSNRTTQVFFEDSSEIAYHSQTDLIDYTNNVGSLKRIHCKELGNENHLDIANRVKYIDYIIK